MAGPAEKLSSTAGVQRVPSRELELFIVRNFLDEATCAALMERIDERRRPSTIVDDTGIANYRTSETCEFDRSDPLVAEVDAKFSGLAGYRPGYGRAVARPALRAGPGIQAAHRHV